MGAAHWIRKVIPVSAGLSLTLLIFAGWMRINQASRAREANASTEQALRKMLDAMFETQRVDVSWSREAEGGILAGVRRVGGDRPGGVRMLSCVCRSSLCRVQLVNTDNGQGITLPSLALGAGLRLIAFRDQDSTDGATTVFFVRRGVVLPTPG